MDEDSTGHDVTRRSILRAGAAIAVAGAAVAVAGPAIAAGPWGGYSNGYIPASALGAPSWSLGCLLHTDAVAALTALNSAYRKRFGANIPASSGYRSYAGQLAAKAKYGNMAATPGTSNHGWALAVDLGFPFYSTDAATYSRVEYSWMAANAPAYGWVNPGWAKPGPSHQKNEPWHWEFELGSAAPSPTPDPDLEPVTSEEDMLHTVIICDLVGGAEYGSTAVVDPINGFTRTSSGRGPRDELNARIAIANALGFPIVEKHVDQNGWIMAEQRYTR